jgi:hypothetical protein
MTGGRASRQKGNVPLSGAARGRFGGDISVPLLGIDRRVEVKCRGDGFRELYAWLDDADFLIVKANRLEPLVVLRLKFASEIAALAEQTKNSCKTGSAGRAVSGDKGDQRSPKS